MFKSESGQKIPDNERCHKLLAEIIRLEKPKVISRCHKPTNGDSWMQKFQLPCDSYKMTHKAISIDDQTKTTIVQSFHPSVAVNYNCQCPGYKALLLYHFIAAFSPLQGPYSQPRAVEYIRTHLPHQ